MRLYMGSVRCLDANGSKSSEGRRLLLRQTFGMYDFNGSSLQVGCDFFPTAGKFFPLLH